MIVTLQNPYDIDARGFRYFVHEGDNRLQGSCKTSYDLDLMYDQDSLIWYWAPSQYKDRLSQVWDSHPKDKTVVRLDCLIFSMTIPILLRWQTS